MWHWAWRHGGERGGARHEGPTGTDRLGRGGTGRDRADGMGRAGGDTMRHDCVRYVRRPDATQQRDTMCLDTHATRCDATLAGRRCRPVSFGRCGGRLIDFVRGAESFWKFIWRVWAITDESEKLPMRGGCSRWLFRRELSMQGRIIEFASCGISFLCVVCH